MNFKRKDTKEVKMKDRLLNKTERQQGNKEQPILTKARGRRENQYLSGIEVESDTHAR